MRPIFKRRYNISNLHVNIAIMKVPIFPWRHGVSLKLPEKIVHKEKNDSTLPPVWSMKRMVSHLPYLSHPKKIEAEQAPLYFLDLEYQ